MRHVSDFTTEPTPAAPWWAVFRALRDARASLGLKARHLNTLAALLSFLRPGDTSAMVFASNRGVLDRLNGACERTFQRHVLELEAAGLLRRQDSPNRKRFRLRGPDGDCLAFGLDLAPLLERAAEIEARAEAARADKARLTLLRQRILAALAQLRAAEDQSGARAAREAEIQRLLRRKPHPDRFETILSELTARLDQVPPPAAPARPADNLSANPRRDVGHYQRSDSRSPDRDSPELTEADVPHPLPPREDILRICPDATLWLREEGRAPDWARILRGAGMLATWIGLDAEHYARAVRAIGQERAAATLLCVVQMGARIARPAAYFVSVTTGKHAARFRIDRLLRRLDPRGDISLGPAFGFTGSQGAVIRG